jgi:phosphatidylglycerol:prolipoprotein diacylglycerol transferase
MIPDVLHIGPLPIHVFGIVLALAFMAAGSALGREFARRGLDPELASSALVWAAAGGLVGARLWTIVEEFDAFLADPVGLIVTGGGFTFYGGLLGGTIAMTLFFRRHGLTFLAGADATAPTVMLGQAIGRWGCQLSGDGDWGMETTLPWGMRYPYAVVGWDKPPGVFVHPTPIYESLAYFGIFAWLWSRRDRGWPEGAIFGWYLLLSGAARFAIEFVRINPRVALGLSSAQLTSLALMVVGSVILLGRRGWQTAAA